MRKRIAQETKGRVAHVRIARPERRNALDGETLDELRSTLEELSRTARVLVLGGEGRVFCAGADIEWMRREGAATREENEASARRLAALYDSIESLPVPVVARVQGAAIGGGVGLVAVSDIAVAESAAFFALSEVRLGLVPAVVSPYIAAKIGLSRARDVCLTARRFTSDEALAWGLVHRLTPPGKLDETIGGVVQDLLAGGPESLARTKRLLRGVAWKPPRDAAAFTSSMIAEARAGEEAQEGLRAFFEKKPPPWTESVPDPESGGGER